MGIWSVNPKYEEILLFANLLINQFWIKRAIIRPDSFKLIQKVEIYPCEIEEMRIDS